MSVDDRPPPDEQLAVDEPEAAGAMTSLRRVWALAAVGAIVLGGAGLYVVLGDGPSAYPPSVRANFVSVCAVNAAAAGPGLSRAAIDGYCQCTADRIEATVPYEEFVLHDTRVRLRGVYDDALLEIIADAVAHCTSE